MGIQNCEIYFDNPYASYYPGQTLNGYIKCEFNSIEKVRGIKIQFLGEARTTWEGSTQIKNRKEDSDYTFTGHEEYFKMQYYLIGGSSGEVQLQAGIQTYPFTLALPPQLASSFEGTHGYIRYTVKAILDRPWAFDQEYKTAFTIVSHCDLNINPSLRESQSRELHKQFWCLCCASPQINVHVRIPFGGYVPGQQIEIRGDCENPTSYSVESIRFILEKVVTYHATEPRKESITEEIAIKEIEAGPFESNNTEEFERFLEVPSLPPSNLINCTLIEVAYRLKIHLKVPSFHLAVTDEMPIVIGSVPLQNAIVGFQPVPYSTSPDSVKINSNSPIKQELAPVFPYPNIPPPSYEQCMYGGIQPIRDAGDNEHTSYLNNGPFTPNYPVYHFSPTAPPQM